MVTRTALAALAAAALTLPVGTGRPGARPRHGGGDDVRTSGGCSGSAHWKLKAKPDDGRIEVEGEIDSNRSGQVWRWRIKHNGSLSATGHQARPRASAGRSRSGAGWRTWPARTTSSSAPPTAGQVCRGTISF